LIRGAKPTQKSDDRHLCDLPSGVEGVHDQSRGFVLRLTHPCLKQFRERSVESNRRRDRCLERINAGESAGLVRCSEGRRANGSGSTLRARGGEVPFAAWKPDLDLAFIHLESPHFAENLVVNKQAANLKSELGDKLKHGDEEYVSESGTGAWRPP
jgi:hypothetical protein